MAMKILAAIFIIFIFNSNAERLLNMMKNQNSHMEGKIVNGVDIPITMFPHIVGIGTKGLIGCGGSIITDNAVLTAAHCTSPHVDTIYAGSDLPGQGESYKICRMVKHPKYKPPAFGYDIGLIFIATPFQFGARVQKVPIAPDQSWKNSRAKFTVAGFGIITTLGYMQTTRLRATTLSFVDTETCENAQSRVGRIKVPRHGFCLIGHRWTGDCSGDSGSGVIWKQYLVGVVSAGRDLYCGSDITPSMYSDAVYYKKWIMSEIKHHNPRACAKKKLSKHVKNVDADYLYSDENDKQKYFDN